jgi:hypothetical protein
MTRARDVANLGLKGGVSVGTSAPGSTGGFLVGVGLSAGGSPSRQLDVASGDLVVGSAITLGGSSGIISATKFSGGWDGTLSIDDSTTSTSQTTGALVITGGVGIAKSLFVGEGISVGGTITYDDVTNIDSVGIVTAGGGIRIGTGGTVGPTAAGVVTYFGDGSNLSGVGVVGVNTAGFSTFKDVAVSGIATFKDTVDVSLGILTAPGIIAQTAQYNNNGRTTISDSFTGCGSQTITPKHATSKILVLVSFPFGLDSNNAAVTYIRANFRLMWNHSGISATQLQHKSYSLNLPEDSGTDMIILGSCEIMFLHDHNTTNEITYEIEGKTIQGSSGLEVISGGSNTDDKTITLLEICT